MTHHERRVEAARIRDACVEELVRAYEEAGIRGLCGEGRFEYALERLRQFEPVSLPFSDADRSDRTRS